MDYRYLKAFIYTAQLMSFSKAAKKLNIAQSAVSRQIKLLEESLGLELIIRSSKKVILTQFGIDLYTALKRFEDTTQEIFKTKDNSPIQIGLLSGLLINWFPPILSKYFKEYNRNINVQTDYPAELLKGLECEKYDAIFSTDNIQTELISSLKLFDEKLVLISLDEINLKKIHQYPWVVFEDGDNLFQVSKKSSEKIIQVNSISTIIELVLNATGIAIVPEHAIPPKAKLHVYKMARLRKSEIFLTTLNYKTMPTKIRLLANLCKTNNSKY